jgi:hypothetical protein
MWDKIIQILDLRFSRQCSFRFSKSAIMNEIMRGFLQSPQVNTGIVPWWRLDSFLSNPFKIIIHLSNIYAMIYNSFFNSHSGEWSLNWVHSVRRPLLAYCTCPGWLWGWRIWWNKDWQGKPKYSEKTCPNVTLSTTNSTSDRRGWKPATNRLNYGEGFNDTYIVQLLKTLLNNQQLMRVHHESMYESYLVT